MADADPNFLDNAQSLPEDQTIAAGTRVETAAGIAFRTTAPALLRRPQDGTGGAEVHFGSLWGSGDERGGHSGGTPASGQFVQRYEERGASPPWYYQPAAKSGEAHKQERASGRGGLPGGLRRCAELYAPQRPPGLSLP